MRKRKCVQLDVRYAMTAVLAAAITIAGCAVNRTADRDLTAALARYEQNRNSDADAYVRGVMPATASPTTAPATQPATSETRPQSLRDYIVLALAENPDIKAAEETARAKTARVPQVTALPDPMLTTKTLPEPVRTAEGDNYFVLGVQQKFPVPEKLDRAGRVALQEARMALEELQQTRLRVIADVKRAYFRVYVIDMTIEIDVANQDLLRGLIDAVRAQVATGRRSQGDVLRAEVELSTLESKLIELRQQRETAVAMLNRVLNRSTTTPVPKPAQFDLRDVDVRLEELFESAVDHNPDLQRVREQLERDRQAVKLARLAYWPDFTVGLEWMQMSPRDAFRPPPNPQTGMPAPVNRMSENGSDNWAMTFGLNIPIWFEKIEGGIREARSRLLASQHQYVSTQNRVQFQVEDAFARVRAQQELAELFESTIIPQARQTYEVSRAAYTSGTTDFLFVIDNWQKWLTFTIQYHRALGELERSVADLEEALGLSLSEAGG
ncbi:MAG TPA: TolC family protein [Phycisphaerae bacterium]|nr:TolC family protein [Phycisphaerae bacterium]